MSKDTDNDHERGSPVIVAITASAESPSSYETLLGLLAPRDDAALVVVLQRREAVDEDKFWQAAEKAGHMQAELEDGAAIAPGRLYLTPSGTIATVEAGHFRTRPTDRAPGARGVIDSFLLSLAQEAEGRSVVAALAGTDGDGTLGVQAVKEAGGVALAEVVQEDLATSDSPAALADAVLPVEEIAPRIAALVEQIVRGSEHEPSAAPDADESEARATIAAILRSRTGHDFHGYKSGTFLRRVHRRMQALLITEMPAYIEALRVSPDEAQNLFNDLLIGVTEFFRDKREWEIFERNVVPGFFAGKGSRDTVRVWVSGCSTGEEAYSIAILLAERRARLDDPPQVQIFASDLDGRALASARAGRYPESIAGQMSPERLGRWFVRQGDTFCVSKELREMCIFSQHSLIKDAPFSRLDLISCRNLLIYLDVDLQERVVPLFHFGLRPGGVLFLGNSESVSRHAALFAPVEPRSRIFRRLDADSRRLIDFPLTSGDRQLLPQASQRRPPAPPGADAGDLTRWAERIVERHSPAYVVTDEAHTVLHFSGNMGPYLAPASGAASLNLLQLIHPGLRTELRTALARAGEEGQAVAVDGLEIGTGSQRLVVDLVVEPRGSECKVPEGFAILFKDQGARPGTDAPDMARAAGDQGEHLRRLEEELRLTRDRLQATIEELETTNEELKSSNEEYQSLNEELQSANEELETSKEELQSMNEELTTVNGELGHRVGELDHLNSDLKNFLESTQIATLFLDNELKVTNFTPASAELFHLIDSDLGRPIAHVKARVLYDELSDDARRVLRTLVPIEREVGDLHAGARFMVRVLPYRSVDNFIAGVVVTFVDVTARREAEEALRATEERFRAIVETARDYAIFTTDPDGRIETWPKGAEEVFGWSAEEAVGQPVDMTFTPEDRDERVPEAERREARRTGQAQNVRWHLRKDGRRIFIEGLTRPLTGPAGRLEGFLKIGQDVTERRATEERLHTLMEGIPQLVWRANPEGLWTWASRQWQDFTGQSLEKSRGRGWLDVVHPDDRTRTLQAWEDARPHGMLDVEYRVRRASDGAWLWHHTRSVPVRNDAGRIVEWLGTTTDVQVLREMQDRLRVLVAELQHRTRNLMGVVRSVADRTLAGSTSLEDFQGRFRDRMGALARVNGLLSRLHETDRITFDELLHNELVGHGITDANKQGSQVRLAGSDGIRLRSATVQTLALALHELATNALKYGALSRPEGRLSIRWTLLDGEDRDRSLRVDWVESGLRLDADEGHREGGTTDPGRRGYGRELIEQALPYQLKARTTYDLTPSGVRCTIVLPVSSMCGQQPSPEEPDGAA